MQEIRFRRPCVRTRLGWMMLLGALVCSSASGQQSTSPARYFAKEGLLAYAEFGGLEAHQAAWKQTAAYRLLNETKCGTMLEAVLTQTVDGILKESPPDKPTGAEVLDFLKELSRNGFAFGITGRIDAEQTSGTLVIGKASRPAWTKTLTGLGKVGGKTEQVTSEDGRKVTFVRPTGQPPWAWWFEKDDLIIAIGNPEAGVEVVAELVAGKRPNAAEHPTRLELSKVNDGFDPALIAFIDLSSLPPTPPALGLSGVKQVDARWGFQGEALVSIVRIVAPAPRKGILALFDQPAFQLKDGLRIPEGTTEFTTLSFSPLKLYDQAVAIAKELHPPALSQVSQLEQTVQGLTGLRLREDLLAQVGPRMTFYAQGEQVTVPLSPYHSLAQWFLHMPTMTMAVETKDEAAFMKSLDALMTVANRQMMATVQNMGMAGEVGFRPSKGGAKGYELSVPLGVFPLPMGINPTIEVGNKFTAFATTAEAARTATKLPFRPVPAELAKSLKGVPDNLNLLAVTDPREYLPELISNIPFFVQAIAMAGIRGQASPIRGVHLDIPRDKIPAPAELRKYLFPSAMSISVDDQGVTFYGRDSFPSVSSASAAPVMVALLLPAVQSARTAAKRSQSINNLKQIMLAYHNFHAANNAFPPAAICDGEGKPLLSWRVAILPYLDQNDLYNKFHLDEAWDSPHNKELIKQMPGIYASTNIQPPTPFSTFYQTFVGPGALNDDKKGKGTEIQMITDGTSNTIAVAEAATAVVWTKPDDIVFDPEKTPPKLGGLGFPGGANVGFCDGSVRFIRTSAIDPDVLKAIITKAGGEVVNSNDF